MNVTHPNLIDSLESRDCTNIYFCYSKLSFLTYHIAIQTKAALCNYFSWIRFLMTSSPRPNVQGLREAEHLVSLIKQESALHYMKSVTNSYPERIQPDTLLMCA